MARMPSPANSSPAPSLSFSTSLAKDRSAIFSILPLPPGRLSPGIWRRVGLDVVLTNVLQHLQKCRDQCCIFSVVDIVEHRLERVMHGRPGAGELGAALIGQEDMADA